MYRAKLPKIKIVCADYNESDQRLRSAYDLIFELARSEMIKQKNRTNEPINHLPKNNEQNQ